MEKEKFDASSEKKDVKNEKLDSSKNRQELNKGEKPMARNNSESFFRSMEDNAESIYKNESKDVISKAEDKFLKYRQDFKKLFSSQEVQEEARKNPEKYAEGLGFVADIMIANDPYTRKQESSWNNMSEEGRKESEISYKQAESIFMESCKILFPNLQEPNSEMIGSSWSLANSMNEQNGFFSMGKSSELIQKQLKNNPESLLNDMNNYMKDFANVLSRQGFQNSVHGASVDRNSLRYGVAMLYQMELVKNKVQSEVYGNAKDADDIHEIDTQRENIHSGEKHNTRTGNGESSKQERVVDGEVEEEKIDYTINNITVREKSRERLFPASILVIQSIKELNPDYQLKIKKIIEEYRKELKRLLMSKNFRPGDPARQIFARDKAAEFVSGQQSKKMHEIIKRNILKYNMDRTRIEHANGRVSVAVVPPLDKMFSTFCNDFDRELEKIKK